MKAFLIVLSFIGCTSWAGTAPQVINKTCSTSPQLVLTSIVPGQTPVCTQLSSSDISGSSGITALTNDVSASGSGSVAATVNSVAGSTAANVHAAELLANAATSTGTANKIVKRDSSGNANYNNASFNTSGMTITGGLEVNFNVPNYATYIAGAASQTADLLDFYNNGFSKLAYIDKNGNMGALSFIGSGASLTGTASGLTAGNVTTNANLSGPISSSGNVTSVTSQTGGGTTFVMSAGPTISSPTFTTPFLGTPASGLMTNVTGTAAGLTAGNATNVTTTSIPYDNQTWYPLFVASSSNSNQAASLSSVLTYNTATNALTTTTFIGALTGNASTVTTNANLTGVITSVGNATSIGSQTGTGSKFVVDTSPTLVTPNLGTPSAVVLTNATGTAASLTAGLATALGTTPSQCSGNNWSTGIAANGNANCAQPAYSNISGTPTIYYQTMQSNTAAQTQRSNLNFSTNFALADSAGSNSTTVDLATTITANTSGNAATATALAAAPGNCSAGFAPQGIAASGGAQSCTQYMPYGTANQAIISGNYPTTTTASFSGYSMVCKMRGGQFVSLPSSWRMHLRWTAGSPVIGNMVILKTLTNSLTVSSSTAVKIGGTSSPTLTTPTDIWTDTISLGLSPSFDYYFVIYFAVNAANGGGMSVATGVGSPINGGYIGSDQTGVSTVTAPGSMTNPTQSYLCMEATY